MLKYNEKFGHGLRAQQDGHDETMVTVDPGIPNRHRVHRAIRLRARLRRTAEALAKAVVNIVVKTVNT